MKRSIAILGLAAATLVAGCSAQSYETPPVTVQTTKGPVICQLYTRERVLWDEATAHPQAMTRNEADGVCREEGRKRLPKA